MKVIDIEVHEIAPEYHDWIAYPLNHYYGPTRRTIYVAHTDNALAASAKAAARPKHKKQSTVTSGPTPLHGSATRPRWPWAQRCTI